MRTVTVTPPSFPDDAPNNAPLDPQPDTVWQVLCGDAEHWRVGLYSPAMTAADQIHELETHDCPELFLLLWGALTLVLFEEGGVRELVLEPGRPVRVTAPHAGFCPDGPHSGVAFVVERDRFTTVYRTVDELRGQGRADRGSSE